MNIFAKLQNNKFLSYLSITVLAILSAFNYEIFVHPNDFAPAGINGIATMIQYLFNFSIGYMSLLVNIPMLIVAAFILNRAYSFKTFTFVVVTSVSLLLIQNADISAIAFVAEDGGAAIMASIAGGFFSGLFFALAIKLGGSTGGTDIVGSFIHKKKPEFNTVWIIFFLNATVAISSFFVYGFKYQPVILCIIYCFLSSKVGNAIFQGFDSAVRFEVMTTHPEELGAELMTTLRHGCTLVSATGMYSHTEQSILICIVNPRQIVEFENILKKYDHTFACVGNVSRTFGNFRKVK